MAWKGDKRWDNDNPEEYKEWKQSWQKTILGKVEEKHPNNFNRNNMSEDFKWTDELVLEFVRYTKEDAPTYQGRYADLKLFKQSKQNSNKDWEIVSFKVGSNIYTRERFQEEYFNVSGRMYFERIHQEEIPIDSEIYSVRRLSDNEVFSVGDKCNVEFDNKGFSAEVTSFYIKDNIVWCVFSALGAYSLRLIKKAKQKLFTTEDGVPKYPMDNCWCVNKDLKSGVHSWSDLPHNLNDLNWDFNQAYYFHDKEKAKDFLRKQKPLFTTEEKSEIIDQLNKLKSLIENNGER